jgi:hypothetical protein
MPIENRQYCSHCVDEKGQLQPFEEPSWLPWSSARKDAGTPSETRVDRLPRRWSKLEMNFLRQVVWRSR